VPVQERADEVGMLDRLVGQVVRQPGRNTFEVSGTATSSAALASSALNPGRALVTWAITAVIAVSNRSAWRASRAAVEGAVIALRVSGSRCGVPPVPEVVRGAGQDVAERGEGVHRQALRWLSDQPEHCSRDRWMPRSASGGPRSVVWNMSRAAMSLRRFQRIPIFLITASPRARHGGR
jgi:hypothetical protein